MVRFVSLYVRQILIHKVGDDSYLVPEHSQSDALPSYASAQADSGMVAHNYFPQHNLTCYLAVPTYWETTVHAPFSGDTMGEVVIDSLPTGTLFSFLWNMLVSMSFQFVGFLLTYLLHTTHAARLGSRAGLGFTLIQYGFSLRNRLDSVKDSIGEGNNWPGFSAGEPTSETEYFWPPAANATAPSSMPGGTIEGGGSTTYLNSAGITTTEWLSFFLMTIGMSAPIYPIYRKLTMSIYFHRMVHTSYLLVRLLAR